MKYLDRVCAYGVTGFKFIWAGISRVGKFVWCFFNSQGLSNLLNIALFAIGLSLAWLAFRMTFDIQQSVNFADFKKHRNDSLELAIQGTTWGADQDQRLGTKYGYHGVVDGLVSFVHDRHVYPFDWNNYYLIHRNISNRVRMYGSEEAQKLSEDFKKVVNCAFYFANSSIKLSWRENCQEVVDVSTASPSGYFEINKSLKIKDLMDRCETSQGNIPREACAIAASLNEQIRSTSQALVAALMKEMKTEIEPAKASWKDKFYQLFF